jgi:gas vesicle protein
MSTGKVTGFLAGLATGALLGILFAPSKGSKTRKEWSEKGSDLADSLKSKASEYADIVSEKYDELKEKVTGDGKAAFNDLKQRANTAKSDVRQSIT